MILIFEWLDLVRLGYKFKVDLGVGHGYDPAYEGYLIIFYNRPQLIWLEPPLELDKEEFNDDDIPF